MFFCPFRKYHLMKHSLLPLLLLLLPLASCNNAQQPETTKRPIRVACVGNSITEGYTLTDPSTQAYPARLQQILGEDYEVLNCGISGYTMMRNTEVPYFSPVNTDRHPFHDALNFEPDIVTIKLGTNDSKTRYDSLLHVDFTRDLDALIDSFQLLPSQPSIYLCLPVPAFSNGWTIRDSVITTEIIPRIQEAATRRNLSIIDLNSPMKPFSELFGDGIHPNQAGAMIIAEEIARQILLDNK